MNNFIERPKLPNYGNVGTLRVFNPLEFPKIEKTDLIFSLGIYLENSLRRSVNGTKVETPANVDFENLKIKLENFEKLIPSKNENFKMELIISICGYVTDEHIINYLSNIDNSYICNNKIHITIFQRPNVGWLWGSLEDVWIKYQNVDCNYWMADEVDYLILENYWYDILKDKLDKSDKDIGLICKHHKNPLTTPYEFYGPLNELTWKDKNNKNLIVDGDVEIYNIYYFMKKQFLKDMYNTYGYFTLALTANFELDAIIYGEIGFCQRTTAIGYDWIVYNELTRMCNGGQKINV